MERNLSINSFSLPSFEKIPVTGQLDVVVMERHMLPSVSFELVIRGGSTLDPAGKEGLNSLTAKLLQKGAGPYSADTFARAVESRGAALSVTAGFDSLTIFGEFLSKDAEFGLSLIAAMVLEPRFSVRELSKLKKKTMSKIVSILDEPGQLCSFVHKSNLFLQHPYARPVIGYYESIRSFDKASILNTHRQNILRAPMLLTVVGDISMEKIVSRAAKLFGELTDAKPEFPFGKHNTTIQGRTIYVVHKEEQTQAQIRVGTIGIARNDPGFHKLVVANTLFGGSFTSRLMTEIRVNRGLTYGIRSYSSAYKKAGAVIISTFTKTETAAHTIDLIFREVQKLQSVKVSKNELKKTKRYLIGLYPLSLETNLRLAQYLSNIFFYGLSLKTIEEYPEKVTKVSAVDVQSAANKYYSDSDTVITVLGDAEKIIPDMKELGTVVSQDVSTLLSMDK